MKKLWILMASILLAMVAGAPCVLAGEEQEIALEKVPKNVMEAAAEAVPGIKLTEAEVEQTRKGLVYEVEGILDGKEYEIEISADGKVLEVEQEDDDEDDDDHDHDDDEDDDDHDHDDDGDDDDD